MTTSSKVPDTYFLYFKKIFVGFPSSLWICCIQSVKILYPHQMWVIKLQWKFQTLKSNFEFTLDAATFLQKRTQLITSNAID